MAVATPCRVQPGVLLTRDSSHLPNTEEVGPVLNLQPGRGVSVWQMRAEACMDVHPFPAAEAAGVPSNSSSGAGAPPQAPGTPTATHSSLTTSQNKPLKHLKLPRDLDKVIATSTRQLQQDSGNVKARLSRAKAYADKGATSQALTDFQAVLDLEPQCIDAIYYRGTLNAKLGDLDRAIADFTSVLEVQPDHVNASYARAACRNKKGDYILAIEDYKYALDKDTSRNTGSQGGKLRRGLSGRSGRQDVFPATFSGPLLSEYDSGIPTPRSVTSDANTHSASHTQAHVSQLIGPTSSLSISIAQTLAGSLHSHPSGAVQTPCSITSDASTHSTRGDQSARDKDLSNAGGGGVSPLELLSLTGPRQLSWNSDAGSVAPVTAANPSRLHSQPVTLTYTAPPDDEQGSSLSIRCVAPQSLNSAQQPCSPSHATLQQMELHAARAAQLMQLPDAPSAGGRCSSPQPMPGSEAGGGAGAEPCSSGPVSTTAHQLTSLAPGQRDRRQLLDLHQHRGIALRKAGRFAEAIQEHDAALALDPGNFKAYFNRAFTYDKMGQHEQAVQDYSRAIAIDPTNSYSYYNRGITQDRLGHFKQAIEDFSAAIDLGPTATDSNAADFYHNRGFSHRKAGMLEEAVADYTRAIELNPSFCRAYCNRAFCHDKLDRVDKALDDYTQALRLEPANATTYQNRATLLERLGRHEEAVQDLSTAIQLDPDSAVSYNARGIIRQATGSVQDALSDFTAALAVRPNSVTFLLNRAACRRALNDAAGAVADLTKALVSQPGDEAIHVQRGHAFRRLGEFEAAIRDYSVALAAKPEQNVKLFNNRAYCYAKLGCFQEAIADYDAVMELDPGSQAGSHAYHNRQVLLASPGQLQLGS